MSRDSATMETAEEIERQISAQVSKFEEADRQQKIFGQTKAYKAWLMSNADKIEVRLVLWPNSSNKETMLVTLEKTYGPEEWEISTEEEFLKYQGLLR